MALFLIPDITQEEDLPVYIGGVYTKLTQKACFAATAVQATGNELDAIRRLCTNLPDMPNKRSVMWHGDHAKFIAFNLKELLGMKKDFI